MLGLNRGIETRKITTENIEEWQKRYKDKLCFEEFDGLVAYLRLPTEKEVDKVLKKQKRKNGIFNEKAYIQEVMKIGWLGGDVCLIKSDGFINKIYSIWLTQ